MPDIGYHSVYLDALPAAQTLWWAQNGSTAFVHDIVTDPFPAEYRSCDILYADLPWRHGFAEYNTRAGVADGRTYREFMAAVSAILARHAGPAVLVTGRHALPLLPTPSQIHNVTMPVLDQPALALMFNMAVAPTAWAGTDDLLAYLAAAYRRVGDFCCGYGWSARAFSQAGGTFVATDYNAACIGYIAEHAADWQQRG